MSVAARPAGGVPETVKRPPSSNPKSSIGLKILMALTGVILSAYVLVHMAGNLQAFNGAKTIDAYAELLRKAPALLWTARAVLLVAVVVHIWAYVVLTRRNLGARSHRYRVLKPRESTYASRSMAFTGPLLLAFIIYHVLHLTTGTVHPDYQDGSVYHNVVSGLRVVPVSLFYLVALAALALHLWHGVWSLFQTLGVGQSPWYHSLGRWFASAFTLAVVLGFAAVPVAVLAGFLK